MSATAAVSADFATEYAAALARYLETEDETTLSVAYELARRALREGGGVLDMVAAHQQAVEDLTMRGAAADRARLARRAGDFLREVLSPYEMTFRGYRDANLELRRLNGQLAQQRDAVEVVNRELESFSYSVSHDLRAPLRSIDGFSQALLDKFGDTLPDEGQKYLRRVREAAEDMGQLIDDLLRLARVTRAGINRVDVDLTALARHIGARLQARDPERRVELIVEEGVHAVGDAPLLGVLLENLLGNAWKFTSKQPQARIEFGRWSHQGQTAYVVRDDGAGFDMAYAAKMFGAFQRLHSASEFAGTGIGLATVERIVRRHGGRVWAEGQVGRGASLYFTLGPAEGTS